MARILLVDDDPQIAELTEIVLSDSGHEVRKAFDGREALKMLGVEPEGKCEAELVLLDLHLPGVDGQEVCRRLRAAGRDIPVIYLTGSADRPEGPGIRSIRKPYDPAKMLEMIQEMLKGRQRDRWTRSSR